jgi:hypothetical protein
MRLISILEQNSENVFTVSCDDITDPSIKDFLINEMCKVHSERGEIKVIKNFDFYLRVVKLPTNITHLTFNCSGDDGLKNGTIYFKELRFNLNDFIIFLRNYKLNLIIN